MEKDFAAIFVDELFAEPTYTFGELSTTTTDNSPNVEKKKDVPTEEKDGVRKVLDHHEALPRKRNEKVSSSSSSNISAASAWKEIQKACKSLPQLRGVDERAEDFISKFRREMKLERERSIVEFQEMLARGV